MRRVYFEMTIAGQREVIESSLVFPSVTIGFCGEFCDLTAAHPGWRMWSVGYYANDGYVFEEGRAIYDTGRGFGPGNTVGCGIDYTKGRYFFTLDGEVIGTSLPESCTIEWEA